MPDAATRIAAEESGHATRVHATRHPRYRPIAHASTLSPMSHPLFTRFGVELEYMVVDRDSLAVRPVVDTLLREIAALPGASVESESEPGFPDEVALGREDVTTNPAGTGARTNPPSAPLPLGGSVQAAAPEGPDHVGISLGNELAAHVVELKVSQPSPTLRGLSQAFHAALQRLGPLLEKHNCMLLPTGMHPTMDPDREMKLWPHGNKEVYEAFNRIFDCRGHGWANLQACHINLPFGDGDLGDERGEFGRLHAAIRAILPILPALSSSSPLMDARATGRNLDQYLEPGGRILILQHLYHGFIQPLMPCRSNTSYSNTMTAPIQK